MPELAEGIVRVANANMERAIRVVSVERGHDPRQFALVAFGGAGGMHACEIAARLDIGTVIVPRHAGVLSALGMLVADVTRDYSASVLEPGDRADAGRSRVARGAARCASDSAISTPKASSGPRLAIERLLDVRYVGQSYEITVPLTRDYRQAFDRRHGKLYGYANPRSARRGRRRPRPRRRPHGQAAAAVHAAASRRHAGARPRADPAASTGGSSRSRSIAGTDLAPGARGRGPAVITGAEATVVVPPRFAFGVDGFGKS